MFHSFQHLIQQLITKTLFADVAAHFLIEYNSNC